MVEISETVKLILLEKLSDAYSKIKHFETQMGEAEKEYLKKINDLQEAIPVNSLQKEIIDIHQIVPYSIFQTFCEKTFPPERGYKSDIIEKFSDIYLRISNRKEYYLKCLLKRANGVRWNLS